MTRHVRNNRWCVLDAEGCVPEAGWTPIPTTDEDGVVYEHAEDHPRDMVIHAWETAKCGPRFHALRGDRMSHGAHPTLEEAVASLKSIEAWCKQAAAELCHGEEEA